jgi:hypothetical protein
VKSSPALRCLLVVLGFAAPSTLWAGQFAAVYSNVSKPEFQEWQKELRAGRVLENLAAYLNGNVVLPTDVTITVAECDTANAFYSPQNRAITLCYELISEFYHGALELGWSEKEADEAATNATLFFFYHEVGHALIDVLDLPVTGREEDAVDQLSTYVLADDPESGNSATLDAALAFLAWSEEAKQAQSRAPFWDEHSMNEQRFFNLVCWVYGQNPSRYQNLVEDGYLPEARARRCPGEWRKIDKSWSVLLQPYRK